VAPVPPPDRRRRLFARRPPSQAPFHNNVVHPYLPGMGTEQVRDAVHCPRELQPLTDLRYRGVLWTAPDGRDWTVAA